MMKDKKWYIILGEYVIIGIGIFIMAIGLNYFLSPNTIAPGGVTGFAVVIEELVNIPIYITNLVINIPLFIFGAKSLGKTTAIKTLYATILLSLFLRFMPALILTHDILLSSIFGGVLTGLGLGFVFKFGGTTGGTDLAGAIISDKFPNISLATAMMVIDLFVVVFAGVVEKNIDISLYSTIALFATIKVIDVILKGAGYSTAFYIITNKPDEIGQRLMLDVVTGVTSIKGKGMYTKEDKEILLCVVNRSLFTKVKEIVKELDPKAFIMVAEMYEVLGEGFSEIK